MECCDHSDYEEEANPYDDSRPRWMDSLRTRQSQDKSGKNKPAWTSSIKSNSPSIRTYSEGGSLRTNRIRPRSKSTAKPIHARSKSPGLFGSTYASRAKQREAIGTPLMRSRANSVCSTPPDSTRSRTRSLSPRRFRNQSASPARAVPPKKDQRSRRDFPKPPRKKENIPIPIQRAPEPVSQPIPVKITPKPKPAPRPTYEEKPFNDRYQFEPLGDTLGRTNIFKNQSEAYKDNYGDQYHTKTWESFQSYFQGGGDDKDNSDKKESYSKKYSNSSYNENSSVMNQSYMQQSYSKSSHVQNSSNMLENSTRKYSAASDRSDNVTRKISNSDRNYNKRSEESTNSRSNNSEEKSRKTSSTYSEKLQRDNVGSSSRKSSLTRGPQPLWLDSSEIPSSSSHNQMRRSSSASSRKSVSVTYIS